MWVSTTRAGASFRSCVTSSAGYTTVAASQSRRPPAARTCSRRRCITAQPERAIRRELVSRKKSPSSLGHAVADHVHEVGAGRLVQDAFEPDGHWYCRHIDPHLERHVVAPGALDLRIDHSTCGESRSHCDRRSSRAGMAGSLLSVLPFTRHPGASRCLRVSAQRHTTCRAKGHTGDGGRSGCSACDLRPCHDRHRWLMLMPATEHCRKVRQHREEDVTCNPPLRRAVNMVLPAS